MARWDPNGRGRLEQAALELYLEHGFDQTTVAEISQRAGLTERTFFRHFADKREVLFSGGAFLREVLVEGVAGAPGTTAPLDAVEEALVMAGGFMQEHREHSHQRQAVIDATPVLQERELIKLSFLAGAIAETLRERGVADPGASLTAEAGIAVFKVAFDDWVSGRDGRELPDVIRSAFATLRAVTAPR